MGIRFEIFYEENSNGAFFTGQKVKGRAIIYVDEEIPFKGIQLRVRGYAKVRYDDDSSSGKSSNTHIDKEKYFDSAMVCVDTKGREQTLNCGVHTYNFECVLPPDCPSSFEGQFGRIRYDTKITIIRPSLALNKSYSMGFTVIKILDLNHFPEQRFPVKIDQFKNFCCGPCRSRPLVLSLDVQKTSFVPGEFINITAKLVNNSSILVEQLSMALNLIAFYSVKTSIETKTERIPIVKKKFGAFESDTIELKEKLQVPPTPPTCVGICRIIKLTYEVALTAKVQGAHLNPVVSIPVVIGNIPYADKCIEVSEENIITNLTQGIAPISSPDAEFPPPLYEEATFVKNLQSFPIDQLAKVEQKFIPKYPFYADINQ